MKPCSFCGRLAIGQAVATTDTPHTVRVCEVHYRIALGMVRKEAA